jgi:hypothetical protein
MGFSLVFLPSKALIYKCLGWDLVTGLEVEGDFILVCYFVVSTNLVS